MSINCKNGDPPAPTLAKSMMVFMVRELFTAFRFPYAQLPCSTDLLFEPFWESIFRLKRIGFKVSALLFLILISSNWFETSTPFNPAFQTHSLINLCQASQNPPNERSPSTLLSPFKREPLNLSLMERTGSSRGNITKILMAQLINKRDCIK